MLYGHIENDYHRIDHLIRLRELQDETGGFQTFVPLAFHPENTGLSHLAKPSSLTDLRVMAVSRLMLDNIPHIKAYWIMLGIGTAQTALAYGADDIDGTVRHELIYHDAGATTPEVLSTDEIRRLILDTGREPVERDTLYRHVIRDADQPCLGDRRTDYVVEARRRVSRARAARTGCSGAVAGPAPSADASDLCSVALIARLASHQHVRTALPLQLLDLQTACCCSSTGISAARTVHCTARDQ